MNEITFAVEACAETGGFVARWDDKPGKGGITTQGDSLAELHSMVADAVNAYFEPANRPRRVRLHFLQDPEIPINGPSYNRGSVGATSLSAPTSSRRAPAPG